MRSTPSGGIVWPKWYDDRRTVVEAAARCLGKV
jgi:hypothetical protein